MVGALRGSMRGALEERGSVAEAKFLLRVGNLS